MEIERAFGGVVCPFYTRWRGLGLQAGGGGRAGLELSDWL